MRPTVIALFVSLLATTAADGQRTAFLTSQTARNHVGETVTVCGHVAEYECESTARFLTLTLAPVTDPAPVRITIANADRSRYGRRLEDQYFGQVICARGTIEQRPNALEMIVQAPTDVEIREQDEIPPPPPLAPDAYSMCDPDVTGPRVLREVPPRYTPQTLRDKVQGAALIRAVVLADGSVGDVQLIRSLHPELDIEAARAAKQWRFRPGLYNGKPVNVVATFGMSFKIKN